MIYSAVCPVRIRENFGRGEKLYHLFFQEVGKSGIPAFVRLSANIWLYIPRKNAQSYSEISVSRKRYPSPAHRGVE